MKFRTLLVSMIGILIIGCDSSTNSESGDPTTSDSTARVVFSPASGDVDTALVVTMSSATQGATIHYTLDGTAPVDGSPTYSSPITLRAATTVQAFAIAPGLAKSSVTKANFTMGSRRRLIGSWRGNLDGLTTTITILFYPDSQFVLLEIPASASAATPAYRSFGTWESSDSSLVLRKLRNDSSLDGKRWTTLALVDVEGSVNFHISGDTLNVFGGKLVRLRTPNDSIFQPDSTPAPTILPDTAGSFSPLTVTISPAAPGTDIHYTLDGSTPTRSSPLYTAPFALSTSSTVKAVGFLVGSLQSRVVSSRYRIAPSLVGTWTNSDKNRPMSYTFGSDGSLSFQKADLAEKEYVRVGGTWQLVEGGFSYVLTSADTSTDGKTWGSRLTRPQEGVNFEIQFSGDTIYFDDGVPFLKTTTDPTALPIAAAPVASLAEGRYVGKRTVVLTSATPGAVIRYEMDNMMLTDSSPVYKGPIELRSSTTLSAVATKSGMVPSAEITLTYEITAGDQEVSTLHDARDGKSYPVVLIGSQKWMAKNLNYAADTSWCPEGTEESCASLGRLYGFRTALAGTSKLAIDAPKGVRGICPEGSHLPSFKEWTTLANRFGGWEKAGLALQDASVGGQDSVGMSILMAGVRVDGEIGDVGSITAFWSASGQALVLSSGMRYVETFDEDPSYEFSIRCLVD